MGEVLELVVGGQVWLDGAAYRVDEIDEASALLSRTGELRRVGLGAITARGQAMPEAEPVHSTVPLVEVLSSLAPKQRAGLEREVAVITDALSDPGTPAATSVARALGSAGHPNSATVEELPRLASAPTPRRSPSLAM